MVGGGRPLLPEMLGQLVPVGAKLPVRKPRVIICTLIVDGDEIIW